MELRLKPEHPDVVRMKRIIADLEQKAEAEALADPSVDGRARSTQPGRDGPPGAADGRSRTTSKRCARRSRGASAMPIRSATCSRGIKSRAEAAPTRETELIELNRDYDTTATVVRRPVEEEPGIADGRGARDPADRRAVPPARSGARAGAAGEPESSAAQSARRASAASRSASPSSRWPSTATPRSRPTTTS